ncbi:MAG: hypothetical protein ABIE43_04710 [Patescibacteria group bacterium]
MANDQKSENVEGQSAKRKKNQNTEKIRLLHGKVKEATNHFEVTFEALVIGTDGKVKKACPVSFYDDNLAQLANKVTGDDGKATYTHNIKFDQAGKEMTIRAQIHGSPAEAFDKIEVPMHSYGKGINKIKNGARAGLTGLKSKRKELAKDTGKAIIGFITALLILNFAGESKANLIIGILLGAFVCWQIIGKSTILGIISLIAIPFFCYLFPSSIVEPLKFAVIWSFFLGGFFYLLEELTKSIIEKDGKMEEKKFINFYPWTALAIATIFIVINVFSLFATFLPGKSSGISTSFEISSTIDIGETDSNVVDIEDKWRIPFLENFRKARKQSGDIADWIAFIVVLSIYAIPGEFMGMVKGKGLGGDKAVEKGFLFAELWFMFKGLFSRGGGKK